MLLKDAALDFIVDRMVDVIRMGGPWSSCRAGRRLVFRLLSYNSWQGAFLRLAERLQSGRLC